MLYDVMHGLVGEGVMDRQSISYEAWNSSWGELLPLTDHCCSAVYISKAWFTPHNFSPYFQVPIFSNELLDMNQRSEASWRWLGTRKLMLEQYVWTASKTGGSLICPPYLTDIQHTKHLECIADIWTEQQPHGRLPLHVQTVVLRHIKIKATTSLESCFSFLFQILEHRKAYCMNEYVNICTRMHVVSPESKKQTTLSASFWQT